MTSLEMVLEQVKALSPEDRQKLQAIINQDLQTTSTYHLLSEDMQAIGDAFEPLRIETMDMSEDELDTIFAEVLKQVRDERKTKRGN